MKSIFVALILVLGIVGSAFAQQPASAIDVTGLNSEQLKALSAAADELRKQPANTIANLTLQNTTPERFKEWADAGEAAGKAVANFTKEIGVGADALLKTDVGRVGLYTLIWKFGGDKVAASMINIALNLIFAVILYAFWWQLTRRFVFNERHKKSVVYNENTIYRWLGFNKREVAWEKDESSLPGDEDYRFLLVFLSRVISAGMLILITLMCWPAINF